MGREKRGKTHFFRTMGRENFRTLGRMEVSGVLHYLSFSVKTDRGGYASGAECLLIPTLVLLEGITHNIRRGSSWDGVTIIICEGKREKHNIAKR